MIQSEFPVIAKQSDQSVIKDAIVFGERNSGTNYVSELVRRNFYRLSQMPNDRIERFGFRYGWKHGFSTMVSSPPTSLCIFVVRHPEIWLRSMYLRPWHSFPELRNKEFSEFIRSEWMSRIDEQNFGVLKQDHRWLSELQYDRHPITGERFANIMKLRNAKTESFLGFQNRFSNYFAVRLEDVQTDPRLFVNKLQEVFNLDKVTNFSDVYERRGKKIDGPYSKSCYSILNHEDQSFVWSQLDQAQEKQLGYAPIRQRKLTDAS